MGMLAVLIFAVTATYLTIYPEKIPKKLLYELAIARNLVGNHLAFVSRNRTKYYHEIFPGIYLGALPLKSHNHHNLLSKDLEVGAVLSVVQDFELSTATIFSCPVEKSDWKELGLTQYQISSEDLMPLNDRDLHKAADFISRCHNGIYIHCKSGKGRAPSALIAYLVKYQNESVNSAYQHIKSMRAIFLNRKQLEALKDFESSFKK